MNLDALSLLVPVLPYGAGGVLAVGIMLILTGRLVPAGTVDKLLAGRDERIEELKATIASERDRNCQQAHQITSLLESGRTTVHVLEEIRKVAQHGPGEE